MFLGWLKKAIDYFLEWKPFHTWRVFYLVILLSFYQDGHLFHFFQKFQAWLYVIRYEFFFLIYQVSKKKSHFSLTPCIHFYIYKIENIVGLYSMSICKTGWSLYNRSYWYLTILQVNKMQWQDKIFGTILLMSKLSVSLRYNPALV